MDKESIRCTIYFDADLHHALRVKAAHTRNSISGLVNEAIRKTLSEDQEDLAAFEDRVAEPVMSYESLLKDLKKHGKI